MNRAELRAALAGRARLAPAPADPPEVAPAVAALLEALPGVAVAKRHGQWHVVGADGATLLGADGATPLRFWSVEGLVWCLTYLAERARGGVTP